MKKLIVTALAAAALIGVGFLLLSGEPSAPRTTFTTLTGQKLPLESLRGKVVLVNFWATSCPGCVKEMPELVKTYRKYHDRGLETVAVAMSYDPPTYVQQFTEQNGLPFTVALDTDGTAAQAFGNVQLTPTTFVIDKQGHIVQQILGEPDFAKLHAMLEKELG
jgi:peroxiredoxin